MKNFGDSTQGNDYSFTTELLEEFKMVNFMKKYILFHEKWNSKPSKSLEE